MLMESGELSSQAIELFKRQSHQATLFVHGYNVELGDYGRYIDDVRVLQRRERLDITFQFNDYPCTVFRPLPWLEQQYPQLNKSLLSISKSDWNKINGTGAHAWGVAMEYNLNCAGGFDILNPDWKSYQRIINVTWQGNVGIGPKNFTHKATNNATEAGKKLAPLIEQLYQHGIKIYLIAHSLGCRVALSALEALSENGYHNIIERTVLWQAAVPYDCLSSNPTSTSFSKAPNASKHIIILHSNNDTILGTFPNWRTVWNHCFSNNRELSSCVGGIPIVFDGFYEASHFWQGETVEKVIEKMWENIQNDSSYNLSEKVLTKTIPIPDASWRIKKVFFTEMQEIFLKAVEEVKAEIMPALGYEGPKLCAHVKRLKEDGKIVTFDQMGYMSGKKKPVYLLKNHSTMQNPSDELMSHVYKRYTRWMGKV